MKIFLIVCASWLLARGTLALINLSPADLPPWVTFAIFPLFIAAGIGIVIADNRAFARQVASFSHSPIFTPTEQD